MRNLTREQIPKTYGTRLCTPRQEEDRYIVYTNASKGVVSTMWSRANHKELLGMCMCHTYKIYTESLTFQTASHQYIPPMERENQEPVKLSVNCLFTFFSCSTL